MRNPFKRNSREWNEWEIHNDRNKREEKLLKDMKEYISSKILFVNKITYNEDGHLEVAILVSDVSNLNEFITAYVDTRQFFEWVEKRDKLCKTKK